MNGAVAPLTARSLLSGRHSLFLVALPAVLLALAVVARVTSVASDAAGSGTGSIRPEIDDGSTVHLLAKPLARPRLVVSKMAVSVSVSVSVAVAVVLVLGDAPTPVAGLVLVGGQRRLALGFILAAAAAGLCCCAIFTLLAVVSRSAVVIGLVYVLVWELAIGRLVTVPAT